MFASCREALFAKTADTQCALGRCATSCVCSVKDAEIICSAEERAEQLASRWLATQPANQPANQAASQLAKELAGLRPAS